MKEIVLTLITLSLVTAHVTRDWSKIIAARRSAPTGINPLAEDLKIVGGNVASPNSIPYQAALILTYSDGANLCGGSLISRRYVLTAAMCLSSGFESLEVILGAHNISQVEPSQQVISNSIFKIHEQYTRQSQANDIALVYLPTPANLNQYVQLIALPSRADVSNNFVGSQAMASGWGFIYGSSTDISEVLRYVYIPVVRNNVCRIQLGPAITNSNICIGGNESKGTCYGDSGGPLVVNGKLVGVASFIGNPDCSLGEPSAFTRITSYLN
ncbi:brachyurin-like [Agrilus planipennis]|uniref:Brachyurin-like n=1 Tax=Agrilus planipennis TaxID=224129 RepID=A0A7F5RIT0_AGRPL|nr:brachyurin-like [Agrilus planipennis]